MKSVVRKIRRFALWVLLLTFFPLAVPAHALDRGLSHRPAPPPKADWSAAHERMLGRAMAAQFLTGKIVWGGAQMNEYINRLGQSLVLASGSSQVFTFRVIYSAEVNARSFPGGYIILNTGMINSVRDEAELAAVLAHEIAHVNARHYRYSVNPSAFNNMLADIPLSIDVMPMGTSSGCGARRVSSATRVRCSRAAEFEADELAVEYLARAGYDPHAASRMFQQLEKSGARSLATSGSHPPLEDRRLKAEKVANDLASGQPQLQNTSDFESARAEVRRYDEIYAATMDVEAPGQPPRAPKLQRRPAGHGLKL
ncbi:MAG TPA: M48 family metalloprotease [Terriglobia bacterium]|jgi:predicted Zn-dependent protease|nr:M48 family metalloprotease [Terriglobia bacterium]